MLHPCSSLFILLHILNMTYIIAYTRGIMYGYFLTDTLLYFFLVCFLSKIKPNKRGEGCKVSVVTVAQLVKASVGQSDVQGFEPHLGHN